MRTDILKKCRGAYHNVMGWAGCYQINGALRTSAQTGDVSGNPACATANALCHLCVCATTTYARAAIERAINANALLGISGDYHQYQS